MSITGDQKGVFNDLSAWFSCSVNPSTVKLWEQHGGVLVGESEAMYLFSDDAFTKDTTRLYGWQKDIVVVQTSWIQEVLQKHCPVKDIPMSRHLLIPHFMEGLGLGNKVQSVQRKEPPSTSTASAYTQYNAVWNKLEQDCSDKQPETIMHVDQLKPSTTQTPFDFVLSQPEFKVYRKD